MANITSPENSSNGSATVPTSSGQDITGLFARIRSFFRRKDADATLRKSLEGVIEEHENTGEEMRHEEREMLLNILNFGALRVEDVMVPRADILSVEEATSIEELLQVFSKAAHSRLPVYRETLDDPIGMVHIKDVIAHITENGESKDQGNGKSPVTRLRREVLFVPPSMPIVDLFLKMQATRVHMALVIDEYGGTDGLVTIEDLVEEIVGEIEDEHDLSQGPMLRKRSGGYDADARLPIETLEEAVGMVLLPEEDDEDVETLGGLVFSLVGRVPQRGELIHHPGGLDFEVREADPRRIKRLRIYIAEKEDKPEVKPEGAPEPAKKEGEDTPNAPASEE